MVVYKKGDDIFVFYRMGKRCQPQRKYLAMLDPRHGTYRPRIGISEGWVPARVAIDYDTNKRSGEVCIEYRWLHFFTMRGHMADPGREEPWTEWYQVKDVKPASDFPTVGSNSGLMPLEFQPELVIIAFRWGGLNEVVAPEQWGETGSSASDLFFESFLDIAVVPKLGNNFEVWTVYIEDQSDMVKLADTAHLIFGQNHPAHRARQTCAMYFLYPTAFEENCIPTIETGEDHGAALIDQKSLFRLMKAMERAGIPTRFPHPSGFYEQLTSKRWSHILTVVPHLRVPPTVALPRMLIEESCADAARHGLRTLENVKRHQADLRNEPPPTNKIVKGVAKLSFSWEALDVKFWEHQTGLEDALSQLSQLIEISEEMTGQPHDCEAIIVQEYIEHDLELRIYVVDGIVEAHIYTKFCRIKENNEFGDFKQIDSRTEAAKQWLGGDQRALENGEHQCKELTEHWLAWVKTQICEVPPALRFDYFVGRGKNAGEAVVWSFEICELGFSMLGEKDLPAKVFKAMLRNCLSVKPGETKAKETPSSPPASVPPKANGSVPRSNGNNVAAPKHRRRKRNGKGGGDQTNPATAEWG